MPLPFTNLDYRVSKLWGDIFVNDATATLTSAALFSFVEFVRSAGDQTFTIPNGSNLPFFVWPRGGYCQLIPTTANTINITPASGVLLNADTSTVALPANPYNLGSTLIRKGLNSWALYQAANASITSGGWNGLLASRTDDSPLTLLSTDQFTIIGSTNFSGNWTIEIPVNLSTDYAIGGWSILQGLALSDQVVITNQTSGVIINSSSSYTTVKTGDTRRMFLLYRANVNSYVVYG